MPYLETAQEWLTQSQQLLVARPTTTRITTKYSLPAAGTHARRKRAHPPGTTSTADGAGPPAQLTLKTYDAASGVTLKYATNKAAEVGRIVQIMGRLGRGMAGLAMDEASRAGAPDDDKKGDAEEAPPLPRPGVKAAGGGKKGRKYGVRVSGS